MSEKILFVDDDKNILDSYKRSLRKTFPADTALGPAEGIALIKERGPYAVVVSDLRMPDMDGISFLSAVKNLSRDTVRVMLTGHADLEAAIDAVNLGHVFRFLTKPCPEATLVKTLEAALKQYRLITAERVLLRDTLKGCVSMLSDVLSLLKPEVYGRVSRILPYAPLISKAMKDPRPWETETAAMLCLLGYIILPDKIISRVSRGRPLSPEETEIFKRHSEVAGELISNIPRMQSIAQIIRFQDKNFDGSGPPEDDLKGEAIPLGARIIRVLLDFDLLSQGGEMKKEAVLKLKRNARLYDPAVIQGLEYALGDEVKHNVRIIKTADLKEGMFLMSDILLFHGEKRLKALGRGQIVTQNMIKHLKRLGMYTAITETIKIIDAADAAAFGGDPQ